jgi:protein adenylyltransferase
LAARRARQPQPSDEAEDLMRRHNPAFVPRNHNVEEALQAATTADDYSVMERLLDVLATPYDHGRDLPMFSLPATSGPGEQPYRTFCGT